MKFLLSKLPTDNFFWIFIALVVRAILGVHLFVTQDEVYFKGIYNTMHSDAYFYLHAVENFIKMGDYTPDSRMPGLGLLYYVLRLFFEVKGAINGLIVIQLFTAAIAVYYLALTLWSITNNKKAFLFCYFLSLISPLCMAYEFHPMTESICTSLLIFYVYQLVQYHLHEQKKSLWIAGLCIGSAIFFRPVYLPLIALPLGYWLLGNFKLNFNWKKLISFYPVFIPFLIFDLIWINVNFKKHQKFIPLQPSLYILDEASVRINLFKLLAAYGGDIVPWNDGAETNWFYNFNSIKTANSIEMEKKFPFDESLLQKSTTIDTFYRCKTLIHQYFDDTTIVNKDSVRLAFVGLSNRMITRLESDYPFYFYITKRFVLFKKFVFNKGTYFLYPEGFSELNLIQKCYKIVASLIYIGVMIFIPFALLLFIIRTRHNKSYFYLWAQVLYTFIIFPFVLGFVEYKYISPAFPSIIAVSSLFFAYMLDKLIAKYPQLVPKQWA